MKDTQITKKTPPSLGSLAVVDFVETHPVRSGARELKENHAWIVENLTPRIVGARTEVGQLQLRYSDD